MSSLRSSAIPLTAAHVSNVCRSVSGDLAAAEWVEGGGEVERVKRKVRGKRGERKDATQGLPVKGGITGN